MKINSIPSSDMINRYQDKSVKRVELPGMSPVSDRVELSGDAQSFAAVLSEVKETLDFRTPEEEEHFADVAAAIENGTYQISSDKIAEKILGGSIDIEI